MNYWNEKPLQAVLIIGLFFRIIAAIFSPGYGMHDDHFLIIEAAQSWVDGNDYNDWLPDSPLNKAPTGHSMFYVGLHYLLFSFCNAINFTDPQLKMLLVRLLHAIYSLSIVFFAFKITEKISNTKNAKTAGLILAVLCFLPMYSVRNLVEIVCIPPMMAATWILVKHRENTLLKHYIFAGLIIGFSVAIRFHSILFVGGIGLVLLFHKKLKAAILFGLFTMVTIFFTQITDLFTWGKPFAEFTEYISYNLTHKNSYGTNNLSMYFLVVLGGLIPPASLFLVFGFFKQWKKHLLIFLPAMVFFAFHVYFPNKQERFILPVFPFIVILGTVGWFEFKKQSKYWLQHEKLHKRLWNFFWTLNLLLVLVISTAYSKRSRVETMVFLSEQADLVNFINERSHASGEIMLPRYYVGHWTMHINVTSNNVDQVDSTYIAQLPVKMQPNYIVFVETIDLEKRVAKAREKFPNLTFVTEIEPSFVDKVAHFLNPVNKNESCYIYHL